MIKKGLQTMPLFSGLFPMANPKDTRFAINYFTSIGLGSLTDTMRTHLQNLPKREEVESSEESSEESSDESSSDEEDKEDARRKKAKH